MFAPRRGDGAATRAVTLWNADVMAVHIDGSLEGIDWAQAKADLEADRFDNGRTAEALRRSFEAASHVAFARDGNRVVGMARLLSDGVCNAYLVDVWTMASYRRQGIGSALVRRLLDAVPGQHVGLQTDDAGPFYEGLGFKPQPQFWATVVGTWLDNDANRGGASLVERPAPSLRIATLEDEAAVDALMKQSGSVLFRRFYDERQAASAVEHVSRADPLLLRDGTYFVLESDGEMVACGGWSRRDRLHTGSGDSDDDARLLDPATEPARVRAMFVRADWTRQGLGRRILEECEAAAAREGFGQLILTATLPGLPLYLAYGFERTADVEVTMPDGVAIDCVLMEKPIVP
jgi:GNAT superfamily N-acetyltransferase